jgi:hypothetical protein
MKMQIISFKTVTHQQILFQAHRNVKRHETERSQQVSVRRDIWLSKQEEKSSAVEP